MTRALFAVLILGLIAGCRHDTQDVRGGAQGDVALPGGQDAVIETTDSTGLPAEGVLSRVALGDIAGAGNNTAETTVKSPYWGDMAAIKQGHDMFISMNCAACHGYDLKGGMGPDLTDQRWRYGASDVDIFNSIFRGRAQGMPAWGEVLPQNQIWELVAYVRSLGGAGPARYRAARPGQPDLTRKTAVNSGDY